MSDPVELRALRARKLAAVEQLSGVRWPNDARLQQDETCADAAAWLQQPSPGATPARKLDAFMPAEPATDEAALADGQLVSVRRRVAGRVIASNRKGKIAFVRVRDRSAPRLLAWRHADIERREAEGITGRSPPADTFQLFFRRDEAPELFDLIFKSSPDAPWDGPALDMGDVVVAEGLVFRTRTGEPSLYIKPRPDDTGGAPLRILSKSLRPLPEKFHGLTDKETRFRQRYVDLIVNEQAREVFARRAQTVRSLRAFLDGRDFVEVETPMLHPLIGGAAARPFGTHHNALDMPLYLRIAPELYLKRLVVGGMDRVYEINRNFRNEGLSQRHNPEFTMLEFYQAYATWEDLITLCEQLLSETARAVTGSTTITYGVTADGAPQQISFEPPFAQITVREGLVRWAEMHPGTLDDEAALRARGAALGLDTSVDGPLGGASVGKLQMELFEHVGEPRMIQPTFVTEFPIEVSPLSRRNDADPRVADRFELYVAGFEVLNAFSELNDPEDQVARFEAQLAARAEGDAEAMDMDHDYVRALEHGLPPTAGCGVGVDRLVMLLTNTSSIREVILFPHMRPEQRADSGAED